MRICLYVSRAISTSRTNAANFSDFCVTEKHAGIFHLFFLSRYLAERFSPRTPDSIPFQRGDVKNAAISSQGRRADPKRRSRSFDLTAESDFTAERLKFENKFGYREKDAGKCSSSAKIALRVGEVTVSELKRRYEQFATAKHEFGKRAVLKDPRDHRHGFYSEIFFFFFQMDLSLSLPCYNKLYRTYFLPRLLGPSFRSRGRCDSHRVLKRPRKNETRKPPTVKMSLAS